MSKVTVNGSLVDFDAAVNLMDADMREYLHSHLANDTTDQDFVDAYSILHAEFFGEEFAV